MKKILLVLSIIALATACKKSTPDAFKNTTTYYLMAEAVDNDNATTTYSPVITVKVKE